MILIFSNYRTISKRRGIKSVRLSSRMKTKIFPNLLVTLLIFNRHTTGCWLVWWILFDVEKCVTAAKKGASKMLSVVPAMKPLVLEVLPMKWDLGKLYIPLLLTADLSTCTVLMWCYGGKVAKRPLFWTWSTSWVQVVVIPWIR